MEKVPKRVYSNEFKQCNPLSKIRLHQRSGRAQIDQLTAKNITKLPGLNLITTGSNVKLD